MRQRAARTLAIAFGLTAVAALGGCGGDSEVGGPKMAGATLRLAGASGEVPFDSPVELSVPQGDIVSVDVAPEGGEPVDGQVGDDGSTWRSSGVLEPGSPYDVTVVAADRFGTEQTLTSSFTAAAVEESNRLTLTMQPGNGTVVGVGAPITVKFDQEVTEREAVEQHMHVASKPQVEGSWHWLNGREVHFRPRELWPAGARVRLNLDLNGVEAADGLWGGRSYDLNFQVGAAQVAHVDAANHTMTMTVNGKRTGTWNTSLGAPEFATRNGTYIVLEKFEQRRMTSCNANITCDPASPEYYDLEVDNSVRLTWSGTFVHSAPWSEGSQGSANVSHGCINLSAANGRTFFQQARYGDVVRVANSSRGPNDLVQRGDPGMADWNHSWDDYVAGSALGESFTTDPL